MKTEVRDSLEWTYPDSRPSRRPRQQAQLHCARNARPALQLLVSDVPEGARIDVEVGTLKRRGGGRTADAELFHVLPVPVEENTGKLGFTNEGEKNEHVTRRAPFRVCDALKPLRARTSALPGTNALLVQWPVGSRARPGAYTGGLKLRAGGEEAQIKVDLTVHRARVPERGELKVTNWFSTGLMADRHGLEEWSPAHWRMIRRYAELMHRNRQNMFLAPMGLIGLDRNRRGEWSCDFTRWTKLIRMFLDCGFQWIEGGHIAHRRGWEDTRYHVAGPGDMLATDVDGHALLGTLLREILKIIRRNGWQDIYVQHVSDEPHGDDVPDYRMLCGIVRKFMPGVPLIDATCNDRMPGALDIWVPQNWKFEDQREHWEALRSVGDELWHYTCCFPGGPYLNRLLDQELLRPRLLHWGNYAYGLKGFLHWGLNHYSPDQDPFEKSVVGHGDSKLPAGDTHIVYPGKGGPWSSMRFEAEREGCEDYELLNLVAQSDATLANRIARRVFRGFAKYATDVGAFRRAHLALLEAADNL